MNDSLETQEAQNARRAENFTGLDTSIEIWQLREVIDRLGKSLGLSQAAIRYAVKMIGKIPESDWRGGRPVSFMQIRAYADEHGVSVNSIYGWERQLVSAGFGFRSQKHTRRHGGQGDEARRNGFDWRCLVLMMPDLLQKLAHQDDALRERRLIEMKVRRSYDTLRGLLTSLDASDLEDQLIELQVTRIRQSVSTSELKGRLILINELIEKAEKRFDPVDNSIYSDIIEDQYTKDCGLNNTTKPPFPSEICSRDLPSPNGDASKFSRVRAKARDCLEWKKEVVRPTPPHNPTSSDFEGFRRVNELSSIPLGELWKAAPSAWHSALGDVPISWDVLPEVADVIISRSSDVSLHAWSIAKQRLGIEKAAVAVLILDINQTRPVRPVRSVGASLVGMTKAEIRGDLNLVASAYGIIARKKVESD